MPLQRNKNNFSSTKTNLWDKGELLQINDELHSSRKFKKASIKKTKNIYCNVIDYTETFNNAVGELQDNSTEYIRVTLHRDEWDNNFNFFKIDNYYYRYESGSSAGLGYLNVIFSYRGDK